MISNTSSANTPTSNIDSTSNRDGIIALSIRLSGARAGRETYISFEQRWGFQSIQMPIAS
jgi:hypothetical protein